MASASYVSQYKFELSFILHKIKLVPLWTMTLTGYVKRSLLGPKRKSICAADNKSFELLNLPIPDKKQIVIALNEKWFKSWQMIRSRSQMTSSKAESR